MMVKAELPSNYRMFCISIIHLENGFVCARNEDTSSGYSLIGRVSAEHGQSPGFDPKTAWARHGGTCL